MAEQVDCKGTKPPRTLRPPPLTRWASEDELNKIQEKNSQHPLNNLGLMQSYSNKRPEVLNYTPRNIQPTFPVVFDPEAWFGDDSDSMIQYTNYSNIYFKGNVSILWVLMGGASLLSLMSCSSDECAFYIATVFVTMWILFMFGIANHLYQTVQNGFALYKVISETSMPPKWIQMPIASKQYFWGNKSINTISELCHIEGSWTNKHLMALGIYSWQTLILFFVVHAIKSPCDFKFDFVDVLMSIGMISIMFIGICKTDYLNQVQSEIMHGVPSGAAVITVPFGYMVQQYCLGTFAKSIEALVVCWVLAGIFALNALSVVEEEKEFENINVAESKHIVSKINRMALKQLIPEILGILSVIVIIGLWMMDYDQNCSYGCRGPHNPKC